MVNEELIGFHKGCINTLANEKQELMKMINNVDNLIHVHLEELKKLGVDVDAMFKQAAEQQSAQGQSPVQNLSFQKEEFKKEPLLRDEGLYPGERLA